MGCGSSHDASQVSEVDTIEEKLPLSDSEDENEAGKNKQGQESNRLQSIVEYYGYPPPTPPVLKKNEIFKPKDYAHIDRHALEVPVNLLYESFESLVEYLIKPAVDDLGKCRALFRWLTSVDIGELQHSLEELPDKNTPLDALLKIKFGMGNHAYLFGTLCRHAGLPCVILTGINKSSAYQLGKKIDPDRLAAQWNAVLIDNQWRLLDVFWACTCAKGRKSKEWSVMDSDLEDEGLGSEAADEDGENDAEDEEEEAELFHRVNEFFFLTDPEHLIVTHLPEDEKWQLLHEPYTLKMFETTVYRRERYFELGLEMNKESYNDLMIQCHSGKIDIRFSVPEETGKHAQYKYLLHKSKDAKTAELERYIYFTKDLYSLNFQVRFPTKGVYKVDLFGRIESQHESFDLMCTYLVDCQQALDEVELLPFAPDIGWGPGVEVDGMGLCAVNHTGPIIECQEGRVQVKYNKERPMDVFHILKHNEFDDWVLRRHAVIRSDEANLTIYIRLPKTGEYGLKMFAAEKNAKSRIENVCNYVIRCQNENFQSEPYPKIHNGLLGANENAATFGVSALEGTVGFMGTKDGKHKLEFSAPEDHELYCELCHNTLDKKILKDSLERTSEDGNTTFELNLPERGEYSANIFVKQKDFPFQAHHVFSSIILSTQKNADSETSGSQMSKNGTLSPKTPDNLNDQENVQDTPDSPTTNEEVAEIPVVELETFREQLGVRVASSDRPVVGEIARRDKRKNDTLLQLKGKAEEADTRLIVPLPDLGMYDLQVYETSDNGALTQTGIFCIDRYQGQEEKDRQKKEAAKDTKKKPIKRPVKPKQPETKETKEIKDADDSQYKPYKDRLKKAMATRDAFTIQTAIQQYEAAKVPDKKLLEKAKRLHVYLTTSEELAAAMSKRSLAKLEAAIKRAEDEQLEKQLGLQLSMARRIAEQLKRMEELRHEILALDQRAISEIRSYAHPPKGVRRIMMATFIMLGESRDMMTEWRTLQAMMGRTGRDGLKRRVREFRTDAMSIEAAEESRDVLSAVDVQEARAISAGAGTFYVWTMGVIEEKESRFVDEGGDLSRVRNDVANRRSHARSR